jgi:serine/threonine-protein kinase
MPTPKSLCDPSAIERFFEERLTADQRAIVEDHLGDCAECRERLDRLAAEPALWAEVRQILSAADGLAAESRGGESSATGPWSWRHEEESGRADLIVGHLAPTDDPRMLGRLGGYEIAGIIGHGGMGVVLKGLDVALNRYVAIKVLAPHLATSAAARLRFAREARAAAAVVHENVIAIHAVSEAGGLPYLVMPYVRGLSLQKRLDAAGPLALTEILRIGMQVAAGLAAAHAQGLVHRDIKPANILLEGDVERLTITDFGLARAADDASLTRSGVIAGTPQFMSPEQARGDAVDQRSDLFSLGSVLYMLCTGHPPFRAETSYGVLRRITDDSPRPIRQQNPEIPEWLCAVVAKLHARIPANRYASAGEVARVFEDCLAHVQQPDVVPLPDELRQPKPDWVRNTGRTRGLRIVAGIALPIALAAAFWALRHESAPPERAHSKTDRIEADQPAPSDQETPRHVPATHSAPWDDETGAALGRLEREIEAAEASLNGTWGTPRAEAAPADDAPADDAPADTAPTSEIPASDVPGDTESESQEAVDSFPKTP